MKFYTKLRYVIFALLAVFISSSVSISSSAFARPMIKLNTYLEAPLSNREKTGLFDFIVIETFNRIGYDVDISFASAKRGIEIVDRGEAGGQYSRVSQVLKDYKNLVVMNVPLHVSKFIAISKDEQISIKNWDNLKQHKVGYPFGWKVFSSRVASFDSTIKYYSIEKMIDHVVQGKVDIGLGELSDMRLIAKRNDLGIYYEQLPPLSVQGVYVVLHKKNSKLVPLLDKALLSMVEDGSWIKMCPPCQR